jgi:hypothetical protein
MVHASNSVKTNGVNMLKMKKKTIILVNTWKDLPTVFQKSSSCGDIISNPESKVCNLLIGFFQKLVKSQVHTQSTCT